VKAFRVRLGGPEREISPPVFDSTEHGRYRPAAPRAGSEPDAVRAAVFALSKSASGVRHAR